MNNQEPIIQEEKTLLQRITTDARPLLTGMVMGAVIGGVIEAYHHPVEQTILRTYALQQIANGKTWKPGADPQYHKARKQLFIDEENNYIMGVNVQDDKISTGFYRKDGSVMLPPGEHIFENAKVEAEGVVDRLKNWYNRITNKKDETKEKR